MTPSEKAWKAISSTSPFLLIVLSALLPLAIIKMSVPDYDQYLRREKGGCTSNVRILTSKSSFSCDKNFDLLTQVLPDGQVLATCSCKKSEVSVR